MSKTAGMVLASIGGIGIIFTALESLWLVYIDLTTQAEMFMNFDGVTTFFVAIVSLFVFSIGISAISTGQSVWRKWAFIVIVFAHAPAMISIFYHLFKVSLK